MSIGTNDFVLHDEWDAAQPKAPSRPANRRLFHGCPALSRRVSTRGLGLECSVRKRNFAKDALVPCRAFGGIDYGTPDTFVWCANRG